MVLSFSVWSFLPPALALTATDVHVESGDVTVDGSDPKSLVINSTSTKAVINCDSFSIAADEKVTFNGTSFLAKVTGPSASDIFGSLFSNGQLILVNQNGITFHDTANVQVGSLIASTLDIQSSLYLQNQFIFEKATGSNPGAILNQGTITAADGGHIALLAESINNQGTLTAKLGSVVLSAGEKQTISFDENNLINLVVDRGVNNMNLNNSGPLVQNTALGVISAKGGKIILSAKTLNDMLDTLINNQGVLEATQVLEKDGMVEFVANGQVSTSGTISAANLKIDPGTVVNASSTQFTIEKNWINEGVFNGETSTVDFTSANATTITGDNTFYNFTSTTPDKYIYFEAGKTQTILGDWKIQGDFGKLVHLISTQDGEQWKVDPKGPIDIKYAWVKDSVNLSPEEIIMTKSTDRGNTVGWDPTVTWIGAGGGSWNVNGNWDSGVAPGAGDDVCFGTTCGGADTDSVMVIGANFLGEIKSLSVGLSSDYTHTVDLSGDNLRVDGDVNALGGVTKAPGSGKTFTIYGNFYATASNFNANSGLILLKDDGSGMSHQTIVSSNGTNLSLYEVTVDTTASLRAFRLSFFPYDYTIAAHTLTLNGAGGMITMDDGGFAGQATFHGLTSSNFVVSNVTITQIVNADGKFNPGPGPVILGAGDSGFGPPDASAFAPNAAVLAAVIDANAAGEGAGAGGSSGGSDKDKDKKSEETPEETPANSGTPKYTTATSVFVDHGVVYLR